MKRILWFALAALVPVLPAGGYVEAIYPLQQILNESTVIAEGTVESHDAEKKIAKIKIGKSLKGKCAYEKIQITYGGGQFWHPEVVGRHFVTGAPALIFYNDAKQSQTYLNRFFFQIYGDAGAPPDKAWWSMTHIEIRMNRTFNGTVPELTDLVKGILAGKAKPPAPVAKIPPMDKQHVLGLPTFGQPIDEATIPIPFRKFDPNAKATPVAVPVNGEGFVQRWLAFGPVPLGGDAANPDGAFNKEWIPGQKTAKPGQHDKATAGGVELRWEVLDSTDFAADLGSTENTLSFLVSYLHSEADVADATLLTGSDDNAIWWLNGQEVQRVHQGRGVAKDQDRTAKPVALKKGVNVLMCAVINGGGPTGACARFVDKANAPITKLKSGAEPPK